MHIISRRPDEEIQIGNSTRIRVICIEEGQVQIAIEAPEYIEVWRGEVLDAPPEIKERSKWWRTRA